MISITAAVPFCTVTRWSNRGMRKLSTFSLVTGKKEINAQEKSLTYQEYVVLDFETTGFSSVNSRVIEIGAVVIRDREILNSFESLCNPGLILPPKITEITGITTEMLKDQPTPEDVMPLLYDFIGDRPIVAHNAPFDMGFLGAEMRRIGRQLSSKQQSLCTLQLSRRLIPDPLRGSYKLEDLRAHTLFPVPSGETAHRAMADVHATVHLWNFLTDIMSKRIAGPIPLSEYQRVLEMSKSEVIDEYFGQGKATAPVTATPAARASAVGRVGGIRINRPHQFVVTSGGPIKK